VTVFALVGAPPLQKYVRLTPIVRVDVAVQIGRGDHVEVDQSRAGRRVDDRTVALQGQAINLCRVLPIGQRSENLRKSDLALTRDGKINRTAVEQQWQCRRIDLGPPGHHRQSREPVMKRPRQTDAAHQIPGIE